MKSYLFKITSGKRSTNYSVLAYDETEARMRLANALSGFMDWPAWEVELVKVYDHEEVVP